MKPLWKWDGYFCALNEYWGDSWLQPSEDCRFTEPWTQQEHPGSAWLHIEWAPIKWHTYNKGTTTTIRGYFKGPIKSGRHYKAPWGVGGDICNAVWETQQTQVSKKNQKTQHNGSLLIFRLWSTCRNSRVGNLPLAGDDVQDNCEQCMATKDSLTDLKVLFFDTR